jgi:hypothetical protein
MAARAEHSSINLALTLHAQTHTPDKFKRLFRSALLNALTGNPDFRAKFPRREAVKRVVLQPHPRFDMRRIE